MISLKSILVPTDFSPHSEKAVVYGAELAAKFGAELHLLHAMEAIPMVYGDGVTYVSPEIISELEDAAVKELDGIELPSATKIEVVRKVVQGHPFVEIVQYAKEHEVDLIVVGTHGRGAIAHMLLGSVAEKVVRKASCPVLVVRESEHDFVMP